MCVEPPSREFGLKLSKVWVQTLVRSFDPPTIIFHFVSPFFFSSVTVLYLAGLFGVHLPIVFSRAPGWMGVRNPVNAFSVEFRQEAKHEVVSGYRWCTGAQREQKFVRELFSCLQRDFVQLFHGQGWSLSCSSEKICFDVRKQAFRVLSRGQIQKLKHIKGCREHDIEFLLIFLCD